MTENVREIAGGTLRSNQSKALSALAAGGTLAEAAEAGEVTERTVRRWVRDDPLFADELTRLRLTALDAARTVAAANAEAAARRLVDLAIEAHGNANVRLAACRDVLRFAEISDLEDRIARLEARDGTR